MPGTKTNGKLRGSGAVTADDPHVLAAGFLRSIPRAVRSWRGEFHSHDGAAYRPVPDGDLRARLVEWVRAELVRSNAKGEAGETKAPTVRHVTTKMIGNVWQALNSMTLLSAAVDAPAWINGANGPDPVGILPMRNGLLDLAAAAAGKQDALTPATPNYFAQNAAPFDYDPAAPTPTEWLRFLAELWPDDAESVEALQTWFGYFLSADSRHQKILFLLGPKRSGKGTIARVLRELIGPSNVAGPTLGGLGTNFGLSPLLGKSVAIVSDAVLSGRTDAAVIVERLKAVSGEDAITVDRKHRDPLTVKLPTRFAIMANELPKLGDASGALAGRLILLQLTRSWYGREDHHLFDRLRQELPGILLWSIEGWRRLRDRGRFVQPASAAELVDAMENLSSPVGEFVRERCVTGPREAVEVGELYREWRSWCESAGRKEPGTDASFGRDLRAVLPGLTTRKPKQNGERWREYCGIRLRNPGQNTPAGPSGSTGSMYLPMHAYAEKETQGEHALGGSVDPVDPADPDFSALYR